MPACSVCLVALSLSEAGPGRFGRQQSFTDIYHTMPQHAHCTGSSLKHKRVVEIRDSVMTELGIRISACRNTMPCLFV